MFYNFFIPNQNSFSLSALFQNDRNNTYILQQNYSGSKHYLSNYLYFFACVLFILSNCCLILLHYLLYNLINLTDASNINDCNLSGCNVLLFVIRSNNIIYTVSLITSYIIHYIIIQYIFTCKSKLFFRSILINKFHNISTINLWVLNFSQL